MVENINQTDRMNLTDWQLTKEELRYLIRIKNGLEKIENKENLIKELKTLKDNLEFWEEDLPSNFKNNKDKIIGLIDNILNKLEWKTDKKDDIRTYEQEKKTDSKDKKEDMSKIKEEADERADRLEDNLEQFKKELREQVDPERYTFVVFGKDFVVRVDNNIMKKINATNNPYVLYNVVSTLLSQWRDGVTTLDQILGDDRYKLINWKSEIEKLVDISTLVWPIRLAKPEHRSEGWYALLKTITLNLYDPKMGEIDKEGISEDFKDAVQDLKEEYREYQEEILENYNIDNVVSSYWNLFNSVIWRLERLNDVDLLNRLKDNKVIKNFLKSEYNIDLDWGITLDVVSWLKKINEEEFKNKFKEYIKTHSIGWVVVEKDKMIFDSKNLELAAKNWLFIKGKLNNGKEQKDIYMWVEKLDSNEWDKIKKSLNLNYELLKQIDWTTLNLSDGTTIAISNWEVYLLKVGDADYGKLAEIKVDTINTLTSENAKLVYVALGSSLLTVWLIKWVDLPKVSIDLPKISFPEISLPDIKINFPSIPSSVTAATGTYLLTSFWLNSTIADLKDNELRSKADRASKEILKQLWIEEKEIPDKILRNVSSIEEKIFGKALYWERKILDIDSGYIIDYTYYNRGWYSFEKDGIEYRIKYINLDKNWNISQIVWSYDKWLLPWEKSFSVDSLDNLWKVTNPDLDIKKISKEILELNLNEDNLRRYINNNSEIKNSLSIESVKDISDIEWPQIETRGDEKVYVYTFKADIEDKKWNETTKDLILQVWEWNRKIIIAEKPEVKFGMDNKEKQETKEFLPNDVIEKIDDELGHWWTTYDRFDSERWVYVFDVKWVWTGDILLDKNGNLISTKYKDMKKSVDLDEVSPEEIAEQIDKFGDEIYNKYLEENNNDDEYWG